MQRGRNCWLTGRKFCLAAATMLMNASPIMAGTFLVENEDEYEHRFHSVLASHFLSHATFGPTWDHIGWLAGHMRVVGVAKATEDWIDWQYSISPSHHEARALQMIQDDGLGLIDPGIKHSRYRHHAWWDIAIAGNDQLRQRMAWALAQIFVINDKGAGFNARRNDASGEAQWLGVSDYYDMLVNNAFGNFRDLLRDVTLHPIMGVFLSYVKNPKGDPATGRFPDENYAREVLQLFSIGLYRLESSGEFVRDAQGKLIETYDNEIIKAFARVFTGLSYAGGNSFSGARRNYHQPMQMFQNSHDSDEKTLLGGSVLPAGQAGMQDIENALDNIFNHPNVGPFIARRLIQRLVKSNPSTSYIGRVAARFNDNGAGVRGDLKAVLKAVLLDPEAWNSQKYEGLWPPMRLKVTVTGTEDSRLREPILRYTAFIRAFGPVSNYPTQRFMLSSQYSTLNQAPYLSPSVFNFYLPDYQPPGEIIDFRPSTAIPNGALYAPEFQILTSVVTNRIANRFRSDVLDATANFTLVNNATLGRITSAIQFNFSVEEQLAAYPPVLLEHLDLLLCHGAMTDATRTIIANAITAENGNAVRARGAILGVLTSPDCSVSN